MVKYMRFIDLLTLGHMINSVKVLSQGLPRKEYFRFHLFFFNSEQILASIVAVMGEQLIQVSRNCLII